MVQKKLPLINSAHGSETRNVINEVIKTINNRGLEILSESGFLAWLEENGIKHRQEVATFNDLPSNDSLNTVRGVLDENKIYIKKENGWVAFQTIDISKINKVERQVEDIATSPKSFGALGDDVNDDTDAINAAIAAAPQGSTVHVPHGYYRTTDTITITGNINFIMDGIIRADHEGVAIKVDEQGVGTYQMPRFVLRALKKDLNHNAASVGIQIHNTYHSNIELPMVQGFTTNVRFSADNGRGNVYNAVHLGQIKDGKIQLHLIADRSSRGWTNQNNFYGGRLYYGPLETRVGYKQILIEGDADQSYRNNGNNFYGTALEDVGTNNDFDGGGTGEYALAIECNGIYNSFMNIRTEGSVKWVLGVPSYRNSIIDGVYIYPNNIEDNGTFNKITTQANGSYVSVQSGTNEFEAGADGTTAITAQGNGETRVPIRVYNRAGGTRPAIQIMEADGETVAAQLSSIGSWTVKNGTRKVHFGVYVAEPPSGERGDISFVTNPSQGSPLGYVCVSSVNNTWIPFGAQMDKQAISGANDLATLREDFNALIRKMRESGIMNDN